MRIKELQLDQNYILRYIRTQELMIDGFSSLVNKLTNDKRHIDELIATLLLSYSGLKSEYSDHIQNKIFSIFGGIYSVRSRLFDICARLEDELDDDIEFIEQLTSYIFRHNLLDLYCIELRDIIFSCDNLILSYQYDKDDKSYLINIKFPESTNLVPKSQFNFTISVNKMYWYDGGMTEFSLANKLNSIIYCINNTGILPEDDSFNDPTSKFVDYNNIKLEDLYDN